MSWAGSAVTGNWSVFPMELWFNSSVRRLPFAPLTGAAGPAFYRGSLAISGAPTDTYASFCGWNKGTFWINGHHLGRCESIKTISEPRPRKRTLTANMRQS